MESAEENKSTVGFKEDFMDEDDKYMYFGDNYDALSEESIAIAEAKFECGVCSEEVTAYCKVCEEYLCEYCLVRHKKRPETSTHQIYHFYCSDHYRVNKVVSADRYCKECSIYLCEKCAVTHVGFRKWRRHTFIIGLEMPFVETINYNSVKSIRHQQQRGSRMSSMSGRSTNSRKSLPSANKVKRA